jgi:TruD family tRNA pseudouridine synthase
METPGVISTTRRPRHFGTIGIADVFLECPCPPHTFPLSYLKLETSSTTNDDGSTDFVSFEITGTIKDRPEDFLVREIAKKGIMQQAIGEDAYRELSATERRLLRVANLVHLPREAASNDRSGGATSTIRQDGENCQKNRNDRQSETKETTALEECQELSPLETIETVLWHVVEAGDKQVEVKNILTRLQSLHDQALETISKLVDDANNNNKQKDVPSISTADSEDSTIMLPSIPASFSSLVPENNAAGLAPIDRGGFRRAIRLAFPLLQTDTLSDQKIRVTLDDFFHCLVPFLDSPVQDLPVLYAFQKIGCVEASPGTRAAWTSNRKRKRGDRPTDANHAKGDQSSSSDPVLRLRPDLTKEERRPIHRMIQQKNRAFQTQTLSDVPRGTTINSSIHQDPAPTTTSAILVHWDSRARKRARQKQVAKDKTTGDNKPSDNELPNILCVLRKREKEHLTAINTLSAALNCRASDIGLAGIKDMKAVTYQFCTIRNCRPGRVARAISDLANKGIGVGTIRQVPPTVFLNNGDLQGNHFEIVIRGLRRIKAVAATSSYGGPGGGQEVRIPCERQHIQSMFERVKRSGFVNFYGEQRVGTPGESSEVGVRTFDVGRAMLQGDFEKTIDLIMTGRTSAYRGAPEHPDEAKVRRVWKESGGDPVATLKAFPKNENLPRERALMKGLKRYGKGEPLAAIQCVPFNVRRFWINAYQSLVWNTMASARLQRFGASSSVMGDLFLEDGAASVNDVQVVDASNVSSVPICQVVLPLPGHGVKYPGNEIGDLYKEMLGKDNIRFEKKGPDEGTAKGSYRHLIVKAENMQFEAEADRDIPTCVPSAKVSFDLPAGSYATMLLRELMLTTVARND